jgi:hypothetical protein
VYTCWQQAKKMKLYDKAFDTEGLLILASANALKAYYSSNEFIYEFPQGVFPLIQVNGVFALITEERVEKLTITEGNQIEIPLSKEKWQGNDKAYTISIQEEDELLLLDHSAFTQICSWHQGDYKLFSLYKINKWKIEAGVCEITYAQKKQEGSCKLVINLRKLGGERLINESYDIPTAYAWYK